ncbi:MAG: GNAT family N-acetyltransferase [Mycobacterium sp.]
MDESPTRRGDNRHRSMERLAESADTATMAEVRAAVPEDAYDVARVQVRSWQWAYRGLIVQPYLDSLEPQTWAGRYTFGRMGIGLPFTQVAVDGSTICGLATTGLSRDEDLSNFGELMAIYVDPAHVGTGVGRLLIAAARERLRAVSTQAALWVLDGNVRARRFYERDGWSFDGTRRTRTYGNAPVQEVRYGRDV